MKTVGIFTRIENLNNKQINYVPSDIIKKLHGKVKIILFPFLDNDHLSDVIEEINQCDGVILPGGDDIYPLEIEAVKYLYKNDIPTLGICLGMQTMSVALGGSISSLTTLNHKSYDEYVHEITISPQSKLYPIFNEEKILVNSRHKDYIIKTKLNITAKSNDDIIEMIEDQSKRFFIGVQWHPENLNDKYSKLLFDFFISSL